MCIYLAKRNSVYYFRRVIPIELSDPRGLGGVDTLVDVALAG